MTAGWARGTHQPPSTLTSAGVPRAPDKRTAAATIWIDADLNKVYFIKLMDLDLV